MFQIQRTYVFSDWLAGLRDAKGKARIIARIESVRLGNLGDAKNLGGGLSEMRIHFGPGYRLYFVRTGERSFCCCCAVVTNLRRSETLRRRGACTKSLFRSSHGKDQTI